ncbi:hypothetical protein F5Y13DRAFT_202478 [Hypoxylon sp. FL1857]|nr:hypothetical protein F5Y13DRAFT_202478 [Hypoxylon sp. FL1857]
MPTNEIIIQESEILRGPTSTSIKAHIIDFNETNVKDYAGYFAMTIDNVLTKKECSDLLTFIDPVGTGAWPVAMVTAYNGTQILDPASRFCERIFYTSQAIANRLLERILPHIPPEVVTLKNAADITGQFPVTRKETWRLCRLRDESRFLKYGPGHYFKPHCDGHFVDKCGAESFLTLHLYLNGDDDDPVEGGATKFAADFEDPRAGKFDINPKPGSLVIFQRRDMYHEGVEVKAGTKYTMRTDVMYKKV